MPSVKLVLSCYERDQSSFVQAFVFRSGEELK